MLLFAAAALVAEAPPNPRAAPVVVVGASATVRIVSGVRLKLDSPTNADAPAARDGKVPVDGKLRPARLIEFE